MPERDILTDAKTIKYEGIMDLRKIGATIYRWLKEHHYDMIERINFEQIFEEGKQIEVEMEPVKKLGDYVRSKIKIRMLMTELKEVEVDLNGVKRKLWKGKAKLEFTATLITDVEGRWNETAAGFFFRTLIDKFLLKGPISRAKDQCSTDCEAIIDEVKSLLNLYRFVP